MGTNEALIPQHALDMVGKRTLDDRCDNDSCIGEGVPHCMVGVLCYQDFSESENPDTLCCLDGAGGIRSLVEPRECLQQRFTQLALVDRLEQVVDRARLKRLQGVARLVGCIENDCFLVSFPDGLAYLQAVDHRHDDVQDVDVIPLSLAAAEQLVGMVELMDDSPYCV